MLWVLKRIVSPSVILFPRHPASFVHNFVSEMQSFYFSESQDAIILQTCHEKKCSRLISLQLDSLIWETASPTTHKPKIVNESLHLLVFGLRYIAIFLTLIKKGG